MVKQKLWETGYDKCLKLETGVDYIKLKQPNKGKGKLDYERANII